MNELERKDVPEEILQKVIKFSQEKKTFTTKELFERYPNNPEFILRYALNNLRIDNKLHMVGNKRGAYYTIDLKNTGLATPTAQYNNSDLKLRILNAASKLPRWFSRPSLRIEDVSIPAALDAIRELIEEGRLRSRGERRWCEYSLLNNCEELIEDDVQKSSSIDGNTYETILNYIKNNKVVTIPLLINELEIQRNKIVTILSKLEDEGEIWHQGIKKGSKYFYKDVKVDEIDKYLIKLNENRCNDQKVDTLSKFIIDKTDCAYISIGMNKDNLFEIKHVTNATTIKSTLFQNVTDCLKNVKELTELYE